MTKQIINLIESARSFFKKLGIIFIRTETFRDLVNARKEFTRTMQFHNFCSYLFSNALSKALSMYPDSKGENFQDISVLLILNDQIRKFFVEFGATDDIEGSNTYYMEKKLGWQGILAEPERC